MACQAMHMWSLSGLVAAFVDLVIAYLLLCASAVAFFASKFLAFFGLSLPCPCDGVLFSIPCKDYCFNRLLVDFPAKQVSNVQLTVKNNFPFYDSTWARKDEHYIGRDNHVNEILEIEGDASCSSMSTARRPLDVVRREFGSWNGRYDMKGKGLTNYSPRRRRRHHKKGGADHGNYPSDSSFEPSYHEDLIGSARNSHSSSYRVGNGITGQSSLLVGYGDEAHDIEYMKPPSVIGIRQSTHNSIQMDNSSNEGMAIKKNILVIEDSQEVRSFSGEDKNRIQLLEQALAEEHAARNALYMELEKERSAAASAADEALAMILRLQEEKACIGMEARQYQRIIEEKSAYDAEEMNILKEILVRREEEKYFLEKEVEAYRVSLANQQSERDGTVKADARDKLFGFSIDPNDDPVVLLRQLSDSIDRKVMSKCRCAYGTINESCPIHQRDEKHCLQTKENLGEKSIDTLGCTSVDLQETGMTYTDTNLYSLPEGMEERNVLDESIPVVEKGLGKNEEMICCVPDEQNVTTVDGTGKLSEAGSLKQEAPDEFSTSHGPMYDKDSHVYDVHVVGDGCSFGSVEDLSKSEQPSVDCSKASNNNSFPFESPVTRRVSLSTDCPCTSGLNTEVNVRRTSSAITLGLPPLGPKRMSSRSDLRRNSISIVDRERLKIENEVGQLRERLRIVQEGRDKLSFSKQNHGRENLHLKLLEDIALQVQEIRHLTGHGVAARRVSLPLPTSKVLSKKKRCRSVSSVMQTSS